MFGWLKTLSLPVTMVVGSHYVCLFVSQFDKVITVADKYSHTLSVGGYKINWLKLYYVKDNNGNSYRCANDFWNLKFDRVEKWNSVVVGESYKVYGHGFDNQLKKIENTKC